MVIEDRAPAETPLTATLAEFLGGEAASDPKAAAGLAPTVLLVDQFEEIVTGHPARWQQRAAFFDQLRDALERLPRLWVVLTLREDFVAPLEQILLDAFLVFVTRVICTQCNLHQYP